MRYWFQCQSLDQKWNFLVPKIVGKQHKICIEHFLYKPFIWNVTRSWLVSCNTGQVGWSTGSQIHEMSCYHPHVQELLSTWHFLGIRVLRNVICLSNLLYQGYLGCPTVVIRQGILPCKPVFLQLLDSSHAWCTEFHSHTKFPSATPLFLYFPTQFIKSVETYPFTRGLHIILTVVINKCTTVTMHYMTSVKGDTKRTDPGCTVREPIKETVFILLS